FIAGRKISKAAQKDWAILNKERVTAVAKLRYSSRRRTIIEHYGAMCVCCGQSEYGFLTIDHVSNNGAEQRKSGLRAENLFRYIVENNFPDDYQVLCYNCNCAKGALGKCPHHN
ncbi:MAG: hypothetical protein JRN15_14945, partial [Nitrososphaerota archaeon]|nr:hypothetical protein [Nitrososphaerota archaeon]